MVVHEYKRTAVDHCVYVKFPDGNFVILFFYMDDMLIVEQDANRIHQLKDELFKSFDMKDLRNAKKILGMNITPDRKARKMWLSQEKYVERVLTKFNVGDAKPSTVDLSKNGTYHFHTKHIDIRYHWICETLENQLLKLEKIQANKNSADMMTKVIPRETLKLCKELAGMDSNKRAREKIKEEQPFWEIFVGFLNSNR
ncbi:hypothetical protein RJ639_013932 [Escallonia herrerae]|uniref:Reverse transcriptase Ty1/copia-type domain-containing protein n=1 Tax=Escallonia herrerae TaxID=1293975 RepID=A0AA89AMU0_9ASTE|nr:hypothetical protein RJ639_013932 [Escallonia herrerae]